jgi:outer membrane protein TolC
MQQTSNKNYFEIFHPIKTLILVWMLTSGIAKLYGQERLTLEQAIELGDKNYGSLKSKSFQVQSAEQAVNLSKRDYLPNVVLSGQQVYGTINGQNGPLSGFGGFGVASSGLPLAEQNWNAAFGALYLANMNWEVFSFGRTRGRIEVANANLNVSESDLSQEKFQHQIRVAASYLNVLGAQRLVNSQRKNLQRAQTIQNSIAARARGGLVAGVDSTFANAEVANAKIALLRALDLQQAEEENLAFLIGATDSDFQLDSTFVVKAPTLTTDTVSVQHPILNFYQSRVDQSNAQLRLSRRSYYPSLNLVGIYQTRASGFKSGYIADQTAFSKNYVDGISPTRSNYLLGVGLIWNLTTILRTSAQVKSVSYSNLAAQADLDLVKQQLNTQSRIAETKLSNALQVLQEAPIQVQSATDAYVQKNTLYRNGLTTLVDVSQILFALRRAEVDRDIAFINVWQALLLKAAAVGDITVFTNELNR